MCLVLVLMLYLLPVIVNMILLIAAYKVSHKESITIGSIFSYYIEDFKDEDGDSAFVLFIVFPIVNIFFMFYSCGILVYNSIKNIRI